MKKLTITIIKDISQEDPQIEANMVLADFIAGVHAQGGQIISQSVSVSDIELIVELFLETETTEFSLSTQRVTDERYTISALEEII